MKHKAKHKHKHCVGESRVRHLFEVIGEEVPIYQTTELAKTFGASTDGEVARFIDSHYNQHNMTKVDEGLEKVGKGPMIVARDRGGYFQYALFSMKPEYAEWLEGGGNDGRNTVHSDAEPGVMH
jgi:hypothetical protein